MKFSLACEHVTELVSRSHDTSLSVRERFALWLHVRTCRACGLFEKQLRLLRKTMRRHRRLEMKKDDPQTPGLTPEARERIKRKFQCKD